MPEPSDSLHAPAGSAVGTRGQTAPTRSMGEGDAVVGALADGRSADGGGSARRRWTGRTRYRRRKLRLGRNQGGRGSKICRSEPRAQDRTGGAGLVDAVISAERVQCRVPDHRAERDEEDRPRKAGKPHPPGRATGAGEAVQARQHFSFSVTFGRQGGSGNAGALDSEHGSLILESVTRGGAVR